MTDQTPQTEAGRRLLTMVGGWAGELPEVVLAIEAQARAEGLDEAEERVRTLPWDMPLFVEGDPLAAVLRAILAARRDEG